MKAIVWILWCSCMTFWLPAQAQQKIKKGYDFEDGVYTSHLDFKNNKPSFPLYRIPSFDYQLDGEKNLLFLSEESVAQLSTSEIKSLDNIWGLCIKGKPYMKVNPKGKDGAIYFVSYHILGRICYLYYPSIEDKEVEMLIYNPYSGNRVGGRKIVNRERVLVKKIMLFETGEIKDYTADNFKAWIQDDERLMKTLKDMTEDEVQEKLFKTIKIYNDRHPIYEES
ncbi:MULTISPECIES: hypothetical protein [unclassified Aureispira]|uniref:hypothetical protein n=1 Tax=unclassified Aureispira TaxID=2649989 RepID=UPI000696A0AF|nr:MULTISPECIES: hypothetical protein [unclassified Aureispira]WMX15245.1 hypothetical protein QP953_02525 [Aureispira sp. CCB-E]